MTCKALLVGLLGMVACFDEVPVVEMTVSAFEDVTPPLPSGAEDDLASVQWNLLASPEGSVVTGVPSTKPRPVFQFNRRGSYLLDRWISAGLSERLTHYVVVTVSGLAPFASVQGPSFVAIGEAAELDARASASRNGRSLTYRWELSMRPALSQLVLPVEEIDGEVLSFVPDVAGDYVVEVVVFDGELWSQPAVIVVEGRN